MKLKSLPKSKVFVILVGILPTFLMLDFLITSWKTVIFYQEYFNDPYNAFPKSSFKIRLLGTLFFTSFSFLSLSVMTFKKWGLSIAIKVLIICLLVSIFLLIIACLDNLGSLAGKISLIKDQRNWLEKKEVFLSQWEAWYWPTIQSFITVVVLGMAIFFLKRNDTKALFE